VRSAIRPIENLLQRRMCAQRRRRIIRCRADAGRVFATTVAEGVAGLTRAKV
jgi:hypothetical protein